MRGFSFSEKVKEELSTIESEPVEMEAELLGFLKGKGGYSIEKGKIRVSLSSLAAARRLVRILNDLSGKGSDYLSVSERRLDGRKRIEVEISGKLPWEWKDVMESDKVLDFIGRDPVILGSFLRGLFLASGSITDPRRHYHLEIVTFSMEFLENLRKIMGSILGVKGGVVKLRHSSRLYFKRAGDILEILNVMGATNSAMQLERIIEERRAKGDANRSFNFITANAVRSGTSIVEQIRAIKKIEEKVGLDYLPEDLRRVAEARLENESLSLRELGELLNMSKMKVYGRLRKIMRIAEGLE